MDIIVTGWCGYEGSRLIYLDPRYQKELLMRYSGDFFDGGFLDLLNYGNEPGKGDAPEDFYKDLSHKGRVQDGGEGGVLAALWRILKENKCQGTYSLSSIPILQQTIEICETFGLDPYRLYAPASRVWLLDGDESGLLHELSVKGGCPFSVIGHTTKGPGIYRSDSEKLVTLRKPSRDELFKLFPDGRPSD